MKPVQIALLVIAGAAGGALLMKVADRPQPAPAVAQNPAPAPTAAPVPQEQIPPPAPAPEPEPVAKPAPFKPSRVITHPQPVSSSSKPLDPVAVAQSTPPPAPASVPAPAPVSAPASVAPEPAPPPPAEPENVTPPPPAAEPPRQVTLNTGLLIPVRLTDGLSSERNNPGDGFTGVLDQPLVVDGLVIAERGARVEGRVVSADKGGKVKGVATLAVELSRIHLSDGQAIPVHTAGFEKRAGTSHRTDAEKIAAGAAIGAIIGAIAGGGKGAAIGAGAGGGAGAGDVLLTRGKPATLPSETRISFRLDSPVTVTERRS